MKKPLLAASSLLLLALVVALVLLVRDGAVPAATDPYAPTSPASHPEARAVGSVASADTLPQATDSSVENARVVASGTHATLRGRCVDEHGRPLRGCYVSLGSQVLRWQEAAQHVAKHGSIPDLASPTQWLTGDSGTWSFRCEGGLARRLEIRCSCQDRVSIAVELPFLEAGAECNVGDVPVQTGSRVSGRVVDREGRNVIGCSLSLCAAQPPSSSLFGGAFRVRRFGHASTDVEGRFGPDQQLPPGEYRLDVHDQGLVLMSSRYVMIEPGRDELEDVVVHDGRSSVPRVREFGEVYDDPVVHGEQGDYTLSLSVLDPDGLPVPGLPVRIGDELPAVALDWCSAVLVRLPRGLHRLRALPKRYANATAVPVVGESEWVELGAVEFGSEVRDRSVEVRLPRE